MNDSPHTSPFSAKRRRPTALPFRRSIVAACAVAICLAPRAPRAQDQPAEASNSQDEYFNFNRDVDAKTERFAVLRSNDKQEVNLYVSKAYKLEHANPYEMLPYLRSAVALERGSVITAILKPDEASGTGGAQWIQVNAPAFQIPHIDQLVAAYDTPGFISAGGDMKFSYRLKHRRASEVAAFIRSTAISGDGKIDADDATNTVYIQDSPSDFLRDLAQIQFYDIPVPQVSVELKIVELLVLDQTRLGLDWDAWKISLAGAFTGTYDSLRDAIGSAPEVSGRARSLGSLVSIEATVLARFLNYLEDEGKARTLVSTRLNVANGRVATLRSGTEIPEFNLQLNAPAGMRDLVEANRSATLLGSLSEGLAIAVAPTVAAETTRLDCQLALRSPAGVDALGHPIYSEQSLESNISVDAGRVYSLGTLRRSTNAIQRKGIPLLKEIPLIKYLFSVETTIARESELFVFVSPTWSAPKLPSAGAAMRGSKLEAATTVAGILMENPSLAIGPEDQAVLDAYFEGVALAPSKR
jgi:type II secretory pathway component GspD/PulD (secretin)